MQTLREVAKRQVLAIVSLTLTLNQAFLGSTLVPLIQQFTSRSELPNVTRLIFDIKFYR